jgi:hypothetical protein
VGGPVAVISAGWEEREAETEALEAAIRRPLLPLALHQAAEEAFASDPEFLEAWRVRRALIREQQAVYRIRLAHAKEAYRTLLSREGREEVLAAERADALEVVRALDAHHLQRVEAIHDAFVERWRPTRRRAIASAAGPMRDKVEASTAVLIAGGNVAVLLNRVRLFGLEPAVRARPVFAWSGGAMVCAERIVLFHDSPPQGAGNAEVLGAGLGLCPGMVFLPDARRRLSLDEPRRVATLARRLAPACAAVLEEDSGLRWDGHRWASVAGGARRLTEDGGLADALAA